MTYKNYTKLFFALLAVASVAITPTIMTNDVDAVSIEREHIPAEILKYQINDIDAAESRQKISDGKPLEIVFEGKSFLLNLESYSIRAPDAKAFETDKNGNLVQVPLEDFQSYKGTVSGEESSQVRLIINQDSVMGFIQTSENYISIKPLSNYDKTSSNLKHVVHDLKDVEIELDLSNDVAASEDHDVKEIEHISSDNAFIPTASAATLLTLDLLVDCDEEFMDINPSTWQSRQSSIVQEASTALENAMDVEIDIAAHACDGTNIYYDTTNGSTLLGDMKTRWSGYTSISRDAQMLTTDKSLDNGYAGIAWKLGLDDPYNEAYSIATVQANSYVQGIVAAHELGHNMFGEHDDAEEDTVWDWGCFCYKDTLMWSTASTDVAHSLSSTNYSAMRGEADNEL